MATVGCAGILVADSFCGPMPRLPRAGELLAIDQMSSKVGGCAANVAIDLVKQGISADVCGCVGNDSSAEAFLQSLQATGVGCEQIRKLDKLPTSKTVVLLVAGEDRRYIHVFGANAGFEVAHVRPSWIDGLKVFYFGGLFATPGIRTDELAELLVQCRARGIATVVDVVVPQEHRGMEALTRLLPLTDYFLPNDDEACRLTGLADPEQQVARFLECGVGTVIITRGAEGSIAARGRQRWHTAAYPVSGIDPSGAGDAFAAGVITGIVQGWKMPETLTYAAALGSSASTAIGTTDGVFQARQAAAFVAEHQLDVDFSQQ